jgi:hypothetical protein
VAEWLRLPPGSWSTALPNYLVEYDDMLELLLARPQPVRSSGH